VSSVVAMAEAPVSTLQNAVVCPHSVFNRLVLFSEKTIIISLNMIDRLVLLVIVTDMHCVLCAVGSELLDIIYVNFVLQKIV
jgi:hypothetical protein